MQCEYLCIAVPHTECCLQFRFEGLPSAEEFWKGRPHRQITIDFAFDALQTVLAAASEEQDESISLLYSHNQKSF